ncbi:MAG: SDR family oxidoreductase [Mogibacterium sp.]|nr:SDR family oxidoreductase [Mogibacterium sp.]
MITNIKNAYDVAGKNVIVTGGSNGLGLGMVNAFLEMGANVGFTARNAERANKILAELKEKYPEGKVAFYQADHSDCDSCEACVAAFVKDFGKIDVLVNNAGAGAGTDALGFRKNKFADWKFTLDLDLTGVFMMSVICADYMKDTGGGSIINITSNAGFVVNKPQKMVSYSTAKAGANHMTEMLAWEWAEYGIRVNAIAPGYFDTNITPPEQMELQKQWLEWTPVHRLGKPIEIGALAIYLASEASEMMTGAILCIDGGYSLAN